MFLSARADIRHNRYRRKIFQNPLNYFNLPGTTCLDQRMEPCFTDYRNGFGLHPIDGVFSKPICCCTSVGRAWGTAPCEACPKLGTTSHTELCPRGPGFVNRKDVNECTQFPGLCDNGRCKNSMGGYSCRCNQGYALDENGIKCVGKWLLLTVLRQV